MLYARTCIAASYIDSMEHSRMDTDSHTSHNSWMRTSKWYRTFKRYQIAEVSLIRFYVKQGCTWTNGVYTTIHLYGG